MCTVSSIVLLFTFMGQQLVCHSSSLPSVVASDCMEVWPASWAVHGACMQSDATTDAWEEEWHTSCWLIICARLIVRKYTDTGATNLGRAHGALTWQDEEKEACGVGHPRWSKLLLPYTLDWEVRSLNPTAVIVICASKQPLSRNTLHDLVSIM